MKVFLISGLFLSTLGNAASLHGVLSVDGVTDGVTNFRCQLEGGKYAIAVALDTDQRTVGFRLGGLLTYPEGTDLHVVGPYTLSEIKEPSKMAVKTYDLNARAYDFNLKFTEGKALPVLTLAYGARELICQ